MNVPKSKILKRSLLAVLIIFLIFSVYDGISTVNNFNQKTGSIKFYDKDNVLFYEYVNELNGYQTNVELNTLPKYVGDLAISTEDRRYYSHMGFDPIGMLRAVKTNSQERKVVSGASTITQQIAKRNLKFKNKLGNKYVRKAREINSALYLEAVFSKQELLQNYLNNIYLGFNNYGVEAASQYYYGKPAKSLSLNEAALLVGIVKSPEVLNPVTNYDGAYTRKNEVLTSFLENNYIDDSTYNQLKQSPIGINPKLRSYDFLHFVDYAMQEAKSILNVGSVSNLQDYKIYTTLDSSLSSYAQNVAREKIHKISKKNNVSNASVVVLRSFDSAILSMIGSLNYFDENIDGAVNVATSLRQPGSALKPITYAEAFYQDKLTPETTIIDEKTSFKDKKGRSFTPYNYNGNFNGPVSTRVALASSLNLPAVKVLKMIGVGKMIGTAHRLGITTLNDPDRYDLSVTLGGGEVKLLDLTNVYASFARQGQYIKPYSVTKIVDNENKELYLKSATQPVPVWGADSQRISMQITDILSSEQDKVLGFGRNNVLILPFKSASKTGTTTDWHDNWTLGYTDDFAVGVWAGNTNNDPMTKIDGVTGAGPIWREVMIYTNKNLENKQLVKNPLSHLLVKQSTESIQKSTQQNSTFKITNPPDGSIYYFSQDSLDFERILFEVSMQPNFTSVQFILNGKPVGNGTSENNFKILWVPKEGEFELTAIAKQDQTTVSTFKSKFKVIKKSP